MAGDEGRTTTETCAAWAESAGIGCITLTVLFRGLFRWWEKGIADEGATGDTLEGCIGVEGGDLIGGKAAGDDDGGRHLAFRV